MSRRKTQSPRTAILNVVGLTSRHFGPDLPFITAFAERKENRIITIEPTVPAVTSTMQATFLTGRSPGKHGIVANMWYDRDFAEHRCWKQSNHLVQGRKLWEEIRDEHDADYTVAKVFWWNNMYSSADYQITPRPIYCADGKKVFDVQTWPMSLRKKIRRKLGKFPFPAFWGPAAGIDSSRWIARAAKWFEEKFSPNLNLVYLPHLDYNLQRLGPHAPEISLDLRAIDEVVGDLVTYFEKRGVRVLLLSEYGITRVDRPIHLNRLFRKEGWLSWREELKREVMDPGNCRAFAIPDHQVAHVYLNDPSIHHEVRSLLERTDGVEKVYDRDSLDEIGLDHERSGDFVVLSKEDSWFSYYYWESDRKAPDYARCVDIHRKPGYDPVELFINPRIRFPKLLIAWKLLRKILGFRVLMNLIPLDARLVKGSHGAIPESRHDFPILIGEVEETTSEPLPPTEVYDHLLRFCLENPEKSPDANEGEERIIEEVGEGGEDANETE
ncbi:MAG: nucleotide pyrophosphatase/phosphodiesterase family protein [Verrucomicrobiota bacterium]